MVSEIIPVKILILWRDYLQTVADRMEGGLSLCFQIASSNTIFYGYWVELGLWYFISHRGAQDSGWAASYCGHASLAKVEGWALLEKGLVSSRELTTHTSREPASQDIGLLQL